MPDERHASEYDFSSARCGRYVEKYREIGNTVSLDAVPSVDVSVWAPLEHFEWQGGAIQITSDTWVRPRGDYQGYDRFAEVTSPVDRSGLGLIPHWLFVSRRAADALSPAEKINTFLLALWIVRATGTYAPCRFEESESGTRNFVRMLDRFQPIRGHSSDSVSNAHIRAVTRLLPAVRTCYESRGRLRNALVLTYRGCVSVDWQAAFVCFASSAEAILSYSDERGLTDRLAKSYAQFIAKSPVVRKRAEAEFRRLYRIRSDIVHGRSYTRGHSLQNLRDLAALSSALRRLWRRVLSTSRMTAQFESDDADRRRVLAQHEA